MKGGRTEEFLSQELHSKGYLQRHSPNDIGMDKIIDHAPYLAKSGEETFKVTIGRSTYEVTTHFSPVGKQSVLEQFKELLTQESHI